MSSSVYFKVPGTAYPPAQPVPTLAAVAGKTKVQLPTGTTTLTTPVVMSTIGQVLEGTGVSNTVNGSLLVQSTSGANGINFLSTPDVLPEGGGGIYFSSLSSFSLYADNPNTGTGITMGADPTHSGDYCTISNVNLMNFECNLLLKSMAMVRIQNVVIVGQEGGTVSDYGIRIQGGSSNSHLFSGVSISACNTAISWETVGVGNVVFPGDVGEGTTAFDITAAAQVAIIGGNTESSMSGDVVFSGTNATVLCVGMGGQGLRTLPAFNANGGSGFITHINTSIGLGPGVPLVYGAGYGVTMGMEPGFGVDTCFTTSGTFWKELPFPSVFRAAMSGKFVPGAATYGAVAHIIRDGSGYGGLCRIGWDGTNYFYDWLCDDTPNVADGDYTMAVGTNLTIQNGKIKNVV